MDIHTIISIIALIIGSFFAISILITSVLDVLNRGGSRVKKVTSMALNADLIKGGYKAYKKIKGIH